MPLPSGFVSMPKMRCEPSCFTKRRGSSTGVRIEERVALLGEVGEVTVLDQDREGLGEQELHLVEVEDVLGLQQVTESVLDPEPVQGLRQVRETQRTPRILCGRAPGGGGAAHGHPVGHAA